MLVKHQGSWIVKLLSVSLGNRRGEIEIIGKVDVSNKTVKFQALANGLIFCESEYYDELREIVTEVVALNQPNKEGML